MIIGLALQDGKLTVVRTELTNLKPMTKSWQADRELADGILMFLEEVLGNNWWLNCDGIIVNKGPGSFTGLRIITSVANVYANELKCKILGTTGPNWLQDGLEKLKRGDNDKIVLPEYGQNANVTMPG
jgi:hypothetical protein